MVEKNEEMEEVEIDISDETFLNIAKLAHEKDITFNQMCRDIIKEAIEKEENSKDERN
jgi:hypothetical protein